MHTIFGCYEHPFLTYSIPPKKWRCDSRMLKMNINDIYDLFFKKNMVSTCCSLFWDCHSVDGCELLTWGGPHWFHLSRETQMAVTEAKVQLQAIGGNPSATWGTPLGPLGRAGAKNTNVHIQLR